MADSSNKPDVDELRQAYLKAETRRRTFIEQAPEPLSTEDSGEVEWLGKLTLEALANLYEAGGTTLEPGDSLPPGDDTQTTNEPVANSGANQPNQTTPTPIATDEKVL